MPTLSFSMKRKVSNTDPETPNCKLFFFSKRQVLKEKTKKQKTKNYTHCLGFCCQKGTFLCKLPVSFLPHTNEKCALTSSEFRRR